MCLTPIWLKSQRIYVPCGHCKECYEKTTHDWANRIMLEAASHKENCVLTLTYDNVHLPLDGQLYYRDVQLFLKKLRNFVSPTKIRFFCSGEYGDLRGRPHYHLIIFGWKPPKEICEYLFSRHGNRFEKCEILNDIWDHGFATVGTLTTSSAFYCAKYLQKLNFSDMPVKPFVHMSLKPGIGACAYSPTMKQSMKLYIDGKAYRLPRFYLKMLQRDFPPDTFEKIEVKRRMRDMLLGVSSRDMLYRQQINSKYFKKYRLKHLTSTD